MLQEACNPDGKMGGAMSGKVRLRMKGLQGGEAAALETEADAQYFLKDGIHYLLYEERLEGFSRPFKSRIKLKGKLLELNRQGEVFNRMIFEEGKTHFTNYATPYGRMVLKISTARVQVCEKDKELSAKVEYEMEAEGGSLGNYSLEIFAKER